MRKKQIIQKLQLNLQEENKLIDRDGNVVGYLLVGQNHLLYFKYIDNNIDTIYLDARIVALVDDIVLESIYFIYGCSSQRWMELNNAGYLREVYWNIRSKGLSESSGRWRMRNLFGDTWYELLESFLHSSAMKSIADKVNKDRSSTVVLPKQDEVFRAFKLTHPTNLKVVILGQNPYPQVGVADGLAFSYKDGKATPHKKALDIILDEIETDLYSGFNLNKHYNLEYLARQGVLLLNTSLTVRIGDPNSHLDIGWQDFTGFVIREIYKSTKPKVFMLWGSQAQSTYKKAVTADIISNNHLILTAKHPASDIYLINNGNFKVDYPNTFRGCRHFSKANEFLKSRNRKTINWIDKDHYEIY